MSNVDDEIEYWLSQRREKVMKKSDKVKFTFDDEGGSLENMTEDTTRRDRVIQAAIHWHNADGRNLEFTETTGNLNIAVAEYLQTVENAPDKLLRYSDIIQLLENELNWCFHHPDKGINAEYNKGFINALIQVKHLVYELAHLNKREPGYMGDIGGTPYGPSDRDADKWDAEDQSEAGLNTKGG